MKNKLIAIILFCAVICGMVSCEKPAVEPPPTVYTVVYYQTYADAAESLAAAVKSASGLEFPTVKYEKEMLIPEYAIIIGEVLDGVSETLSENLAELDYKIEKTGGRIYCCGGSSEATEASVEYMINTLVQSRGIEMEDGFKYVYDHPYPLENALINGVPLGDFSLIYAFTEDEAKYKDVANDFRKYIRTNGNVRIQMFPHGKSETENEIVIGIVPNRAITSSDSTANYKYDEYKITVDGGKVSVTGNNACAVWHGCIALAEAISSSENRSLTDTVITGKCKLIKVSCVGDSITDGAGSSDPHNLAYPVILQRMLGFDYLVKNHGHSGYSVVFTDEYSYSKSPKYTEARAFKPDVVIFMLGTNDCNPGQAYKNWDDGTREVKYREDVRKYFDAFRSIKSDVQIFMCIPPTLCYSTVWPWEAWAANIEKYTSVINREIAEEESLPIVDMYSWSKEHPEAFGDGLHPSDSGYKIYAQRVYDEIIDVLIKPEK